MPLDPTLDPLLPKQERLLRITGNYDVQVDIWSNFEVGGGGSTEFAGLMVGQNGIDPGRASGGGFAYSSDAGAANDYRILKAEPGATFNGNFGRQIVTGPAFGAPVPPDDSPVFDQQYNPEIVKTYLLDEQFGGASGSVGFANDNENDFWQNAFPTRNYGIALDPDSSQTAVFPFQAIGQGPNQSGVPAPGGNPPGDAGFRWVTLRMEVRPNEQGYGFGREEARFRDELGVARIYMQAAWQGIDESGAALLDEFGNPVTLVSPELYIGVLDNSIARGRDADPLTEVIDFSNPIGLIQFDPFASVNESDFNFAIFDNLIITSLPSTVIAGDYNDDGFVDAADYTVWRDNLGTTNALPNDTIGGTIGQAQYDAWKAAFVNPAFGGGASAAPVPEPIGWATALILAVCGWTARRRAPVTLRTR